MVIGYPRSVILHDNFVSLSLHKGVAAEHGGEVVAGTGQDKTVGKHTAITENYLDIIETVIHSEEQKIVDDLITVADDGRRWWGRIIGGHFEVIHFKFMYGRWEPAGGVLPTLRGIVLVLV